MDSHRIDQEIKNVEESMDELWSTWSESKKSLYLSEISKFKACCLDLRETWIIANGKIELPHRGLLSKILNKVHEEIIYDIRGNYFNIKSSYCMRWGCDNNTMINFASLYINGFAENAEWELKLLSFYKSIMDKIDESFDSPTSYESLNF